jgi:hypothetical protein
MFNDLMNKSNNQTLTFNENSNCSSSVSSTENSLDTGGSTQTGNVAAGLDRSKLRMRDFLYYSPKGVSLNK